MSSSGCGAQTAITSRAVGSSKCPIHQGKEVISFCEDCDVLICSDCLSLHKRHALEGLDNIIPDIKNKLEGIVNKLQDTHLPKVREEILAIEDGLSKNEEQFENLVNKKQNQNKKLKEELDRMTEQYTLLCRGIQEQNSVILQNSKIRLEYLEDELSSELANCQNILQTGTNVQLFDRSRDLSDLELPSQPELQKVDFTEWMITLQLLKQQIEEFSEELVQETTTLQEKQQTSWDMTAEFKFRDKLNPSTMQAIHSPDHKAMVCVTPSKKLISINSTGQTQTMEMNEGVMDFCFSPVPFVPGSIWFCSSGDESVREIKGTSSSVKFKTKGQPLCICVTSDENIVIGVPNKIIKYNQNGKVIRETPSAGNALRVIYPWRISSECPRTKNLAIVDWDKPDFGGDGKPRVSILDTYLRVLYSYKGEGREQPSVKDFFPYDAKFNNKGDLLVTSQKSVLMISGKAEYIETVFTDPELSAYCLCVQNDGSIWVSFGEDSVKIFKPC